MRAGTFGLRRGCYKGVETATALPLRTVEDLYASTYRRLVGVLSAASGSVPEAEEVVQEAFIRLLPKWPQVRDYDDPEAWVRTVAFRLLSNRMRKARRGVLALLVHSPPPPTLPATTDRIDVERALARLTLGQRQVLVLHHLVQLEIPEIAATLGIPVGTVKSRLSRGRAALAAVLSEENEQ